MIRVFCSGNVVVFSVCEKRYFCKQNLKSNEFIRLTIIQEIIKIWGVYVILYVKLLKKSN